MSEVVSAMVVHCARLCRLAAQEAHPARFGSLPDALVKQMRGSVLGRRMLLRMLAEGDAPELLSEPVWDIPESAAWLYWPRAALAELAWDLAAIALATPIRAVVRRDAVLRLRRVLTPARYRLALGEPIRVDAHGEFAAAIASDEALGQVFVARGYAELIAFARTIHPACAARIRVTLPPGEVPNEMPELSAQRVAEHLEWLRRAAEASGSEADRVVDHG